MAERATWTTIPANAWDLLNQRLARVVSLLARPARATVRTVNTNAVLTEGDDVVLVDTTAGAVTLTTPRAARDFTGQLITVQRVAGANGVTFDPLGSETVNGSASASVTSARLVSDGTAWFTIT